MRWYAFQEAGREAGLFGAIEGYGLAELLSDGRVQVPG